MDILLTLCRKAAPFVTAQNADQMEHLGTLLITGGLAALIGLSFLRKQAGYKARHEKR